MYLDRDYRPRRRRRGFFGRFWPLLLFGALAVVLFETRPTWLVPRVAAPTPTPTLSTVSFLADAESALARGDYGAALAAYQRMAQLDPTNPEPLVQQARLHMVELDPNGAFEAASRALELDEKNPAALTALAHAEDWLGQYENALNHALDALELDPAKCRNPRRARRDLRRRRQLLHRHRLHRPGPRPRPRPRAGAAEQRPTCSKNRASTRTPSPPSTAPWPRNPERADLYLEKARIYRVGLNDYAQALTAYRAAVDANQTPQTLDAFGEGLYNAGDHLQAVRILRQALELDPDYPPALVHLGMALYARRNYEDAAASFDRGLPLFPQAREEHYYTAGLAHIYKEPRECNLAEPWLRKALETKPAERARAGRPAHLRRCNPGADTARREPGNWRLPGCRTNRPRLKSNLTQEGQLDRRAPPRAPDDLIPPVRRRTEDGLNTPGLPQAPASASGTDARRPRKRLHRTPHHAPSTLRSCTSFATPAASLRPAQFLLVLASPVSRSCCLPPGLTAEGHSAIALFVFTGVILSLQPAPLPIAALLVPGRPGGARHRQGQRRLRAVSPSL